MIDEIENDLNKAEVKSIELNDELNQLNDIFIQNKIARYKQKKKIEEHKTYIEDLEVLLEDEQYNITS